MLNTTIVEALKKEIKKTVGCTDPIGIALATAVAVNKLSEYPEGIKVVLSENIYKNAVSVGIPGIEERGIEYASALGSFLHKSIDKGLEILDYADENIREKSKEIIEENIISVEIIEKSPDPLFVKVEAKKGSKLSTVILKGDYDNIAEILLNDERIYLHENKIIEENLIQEIKNYKINELIDCIKGMDYKELNFLMDYAKINKASYEKSEKFENLYEIYTSEKNELSCIEKAKKLAKKYTFSLTYARMTGKKLPVSAICGSGNHGIVNFLGVLAVSEVLKSSEEETIKALAISSIITIYIKGCIKRMTAFCGCSVAASAGVTSATVYLLKGNNKQINNGINALLGTLAGMICDGAKESCAYKVSTGVEKAIEYGFLAKEDLIKDISGLGIISSSLEDTFNNLGLLNNPGMVETDKCIVNIIKDNKDIKK